MQFYETPTPNDEGKPSDPIPAETEAQVPKDRAAAKKAISGGFCLTVFQTLVCVLILLAAFFLRGFLPELKAMDIDLDRYDKLRAIYDAELNRSVLILQDDVPYS